MTAKVFFAFHCIVLFCASTCQAVRSGVLHSACFDQSKSCTQQEGNLPPIWAFFGYDEANYTYMKDGRKLLTEIANLSPVTVCVRTHHFMTSGNGTPGLKWSSTNAYTEDATGKPVYNWKIIDSIFDTYVNRGMRPIAEIVVLCPEAMSVKPRSVSEPDTSGNGKPTHLFRMVVSPKIYEKWAELILSNGVRHSVQRYGKAAVVEGEVLGGLERT